MIEITKEVIDIMFYVCSGGVIGAIFSYVYFKYSRSPKLMGIKARMLGHYQHGDIEIYVFRRGELKDQTKLNAS